MTNIISAASDAFINPDSPWYYVIGVVCLVLVFALLAVYIVVSGKRKKAKEKRELENAEKAADGNTENAEKATEDIGAEQDKTLETTDIEQKSDENSANVVAEEPTATEYSEETAEKETPEEPVTPVVEQEEEKTQAEEKEKAAEPVAESTQPPAQKPKAKGSAAASTQKVEVKSGENGDNTAPKPKAKGSAAANTQKVEVKAEENNESHAPKSKAKGSAAAGTQKVEVKSEENGDNTAQKPKTATKPKKAEKPFLDRLIAAKSLHGVYNELKNTVLSYPGIKAKISKEEETFLFGTEKKAAIALDGEQIILKLYIDPTTAPKQFGAEKSNDAELPTRLKVGQSNIDNAQKLIVFAMNVALLTRNDRHRHVDYVKNAIAAKAKAKKK